LHHRCEQTLLALTAVDEASILIGPEGGLSEMEINQANQAGYRSLLLGPPSGPIKMLASSTAVNANKVCSQR
jgi:16S rRNA (uracil1498-N3)-methyltransferase